MKIKNHWVVFGAILVFVALGLCAFSQTQQGASQTKEDILKLIPQGWKNEHPEAMESLADRILADNKDLAEFFLQERFADMTLRYAELEGKVKDDQDQEHKSRESVKFRDFWKGVWKKGARLEFRTTKIEIRHRTGNFRDGRPYDMLATVTHEYSIVTAVSDASFDPPGVVVICHQTECTWHGRG